MSKIENSDIRDLTIHQSIGIASQGNDAPTYWQCMRVESGYIYTRWDSEKQTYIKGSEVFVPHKQELYIR